MHLVGEAIFSNRTSSRMVLFSTAATRIRGTTSKKAIGARCRAMAFNLLSADSVKNLLTVTTIMTAL